MKKFFPYILILVILIGLFSSVNTVSAQTAVDESLGSCYVNYSKATPPYNETKQKLTNTECTNLKNPTSGVTATFNPYIGTCRVIGVENGEYTNYTKVQCNEEAKKPENKTRGVTWTSEEAGFITIKYAGASAPIPGGGTTTGTAQDEAPQPKSDFEKQIDTGCNGIFDSTLKGCLLKFTYYTYFQLPALILWLSAQFFNVLIRIGLDSNTIASSGFIPAAWGVVRDFSNIFFILILLYVAIRVILGLGGHEVKKTIARVVVMAMLINFSMFFTSIVIDASNVLALVFYNKLDTTYVDSNGNRVERPNSPSTPYNEKDISGAMYKNFNATNMINGPFIEALKTTTINGQTVKEDGLPFAITFGIMIIAGSIMLFAAYAFFVSGFMFLGRLIELWILIIFSPFAFMSSAVPKLAGTDYIGWKAWSTRLISTSFMAPIFMFFMYLIFKILEKNIFEDFVSGDGAITKILGVLIPALIVLGLLMKATKFAEKGGGQFGEIVAKWGGQLGGMVAGLAIGAATGGAGLVASGTLGRASSAIAGSKTLDEMKTKSGARGWGARMALKAANYGAGASFDLRKAPGIEKLAAKSGVINMGTLGSTLSTEGGYKGLIERKAKAFKEQSKIYKTIMSDDEVKAWSNELRAKYEEAKNEAKKKPGFDEDKYKEAHPEPKTYTSAKELNKDRLHDFEKSLGKEGLLGQAIFKALEKSGNMINEKNFEQSEAYKTAYRQKNATSDFKYDSKIAEQVNKDRAKKVKMIIGGGAAIAAGSVTGGMTLGGLGAIGGAGLSAGALGYMSSTQAAKSKFAKDEKKEHKDLEKIEKRIEEMKELLKSQAEVLGSKEMTETGITKLEDKKKDAYGNAVYSIDPEKLSENIAKETATQEDLQAEIRSLAEKITQMGGGNNALNARRAELRGELQQSITRLNKFNLVKGADKSIAETRNKLYDLEKEQGKIEKEHEAHDKPAKKSGGGGGHSAPAHKKEEHPEPAHEPEGNSGGAHGEKPTH